MTTTCGYSVTDDEGNEQPCNRPVTGWRWYQDCGHEDMLDEACILHENVGGNRLHATEAKRDALAAKVAAVRELHQPANIQLWQMDCINGDCLHYDGDTYDGEFPTPACPTAADRVCAECYRAGDRPDDGWEAHFTETVAWPCPTIRALDAQETHSQRKLTERIEA